MKQSLGTTLFLYVLAGALTGLGGMTFLFYQILEKQAKNDIKKHLNTEVLLIEEQLAEAERTGINLAISVKNFKVQGITESQAYEALVFDTYLQRPKLSMAAGFGQTPYGILGDRQWYWPYFYQDQKAVGQLGKSLPSPYQDSLFCELFKDDNYPKQNYYTLIANNGKNQWMEPYRWYGITMTTYLAPIRDHQNQLIGMTGIDVNVSAMSKALDKAVFSGGGYFTIISQQGHILAYPPNPSKAEALATYADVPELQEYWQEFKAHSNNFFQTQQNYLVWQKVRRANWFMVAVVPRALVFQPVFFITVGSALGAGLILAIVVFIFVKQLNHRLQPIVEKCHTIITQKHPNILIQTPQEIRSQGDEIQVLTQSFYQMTQELQDTLGQLKDSFETLECKNEELLVAEENYRGIFENALEGIFQSSPDGKFISLNPAMARIYGYNSPQEMIEQITNIGEQLYINASERDEFRCLMKDRGKVQNFEFQAYRQDHSIIWAQMDARAVCDRQGQIAYYEGIVQDISDRKRQKVILEAMVKERTTDLATANEAIVALNEKLKEDNFRMAAELDIVRQMQQMILPNADELEIDGLDIAGYMDAADEVGGDYYDVLNTDGVVTLGIGDVTGHGLESGILMLMAQTAVRTLNEIRELDSVRFLDVINRTLYKNVKRMNSEKSLTLAILNYSQGWVSISGQHEETIIVRLGGEIERIDTMDLGFPIALHDDIAEFISHISLELQPGDGVVLYTDGIPEAKDINKKQYGLEPMCEVISQNWHLSAEEIKQAVIDDVRRHIGTQKVFDDITLLVLKRTQLGVENKSQPQAATWV
ncbi:SpoIIE family protein phosphatase [Microcoleus sp. S13_B4]|uniref:SpoIIE family protein phosphatase n=1 Tax=Microcoleus sp. S13_B4 TaxID=3055408 RepID=UPI002FD44C86